MIIDFVFGGWNKTKKVKKSEKEGWTNFTVAAEPVIVRLTKIDRTGNIYFKFN